MGMYVNTDSKGKDIGASFESKIASLLADGAVQTNGKEFEKDLVCVVDNGFFAAAGYCFNEREYACFSDTSDTRRKAWFTYEHVVDVAA
jgi:hypothetical protein